MEESFSSSLGRTCFKNSCYDADIREKNCQKADSFHQISEDHQNNIMYIHVRAGQREEWGDITKEMVNFSGAERQIKGISGVNNGAHGASQKGSKGKLAANPFGHNNRIEQWPADGYIPVISYGSQ